MIPIPRDAVPFDGCQQCGKAPCVCIPAIEFHGGKRPHEMTTAELLDAIDFAGPSRPEWRKKLCDEFDARRISVASPPRA